jgi:hypothetical protein
VKPSKKPAKPGVAAAIATLVLGAGCTSSGHRAAPGQQSALADTPTTTSSCLWREGTEANDFVGLSESRARERAEQRGLALRIQGRDDRCIGGTDDLRPDRVNVVLVGDRVADARRY